jgi:RimJ/RimL family protein N-acetyltransferase
VIRLDSGDLIGFVQATVTSAGSASIAYVLGSAWWGQGLATTAVHAMTEELVTHYRVKRLTATLKQTNQRSLRLLQRIGFSRAPDSAHRAMQIEADELLTHKLLAAVDSDDA